MKYDYVVIGAGASGLSAAIILAKNGFDVAVIEKSNRTAPLIRGFSRNGVHFDTGFHHTGSFGDGETLDLLFRYLGLSDRLEKEPFPPDCFDLFRCLETDFEFRFPYGYDRIRERLIETFPEEAKAVSEYLRAVRDTFNSFPYIKLDPTQLQASARKNVNGPSLKEFLDKLTSNQTLKWTLSLHSILYGVSPEEASFTFNAGVVGSYYESVHGIKGGGISLANAYDDILQELGIDVYCGQGVSEILFSSNNSPSGVRLEDETDLVCHGCVSTIHPKKFLKLVPEYVFRPAYRKRLQQLDESISAFILYAGCKTRPALIANNNMLVTSDWDLTNFRQEDVLESRPLYICRIQQSNDQPEAYGLIGIVPASFNQVDTWSSSFLGKRPKDYELFKEKVRNRLVRYIERCVPDIACSIKFSECSTPLTLRDYTDSPYGSVYGVKHKVGQYNPMTLTKSKGLLLAGQSTVAPGVLGAVISAFLTVGFIIGHDKILKQLRNLR